MEIKKSERTERERKFLNETGPCPEQVIHGYPAHCRNFNVSLIVIYIRLNNDEGHSLRVTHWEHKYSAYARDFETALYTKDMSDGQAHTKAHERRSSPSPSDQEVAILSTTTQAILQTKKNKKNDKNEKKIK